MKNINTIISEIQAAAAQKTVDSIWERVACINSALDDAYGSALGGHYASALTCASEAVAAYDELLDLCAETPTSVLRENLRDAIGSVNFDKFELPAHMQKALLEKRDRVCNPGFKADPICVVPNDVVAVDKNTIAVDGKFFVMENGRWVYDSDVNYDVHIEMKRKDLEPSPILFDIDDEELFPF